MSVAFLSLRIMVLKRIVLILSLLLWSLSALASPVGMCSGLFVSDTEFLNQQMSQHYPHLKFVVENPDVFVAKMRERFNEQKIKTPNDPYMFDYSELGMPLVKDLVKDLDTWKAELDVKISKQSLNKDLFSRHQVKEMQILSDYSTALSKEAAGYLLTGKVTYKQIIEFAYFYARMRGSLEARTQTPLLRLYLFIDRTILNGHHPKSAAQEYNHYLKRRFSVFTGKGFSPGFREAAAPFAKASFNPEKLETVWIPTNAPLERNIFMRLLSRDINFIGVTNTPILADGILRPSSDFWAHDARHESVKFFLLKNYKLKKELTQNQAEQLSINIDKWLVELNHEVANVENKELRGAIELLIFSYHHDRGFPLIPSVYLTPNKQVFYTIVLYAMQKTAGEEVQFSNPSQNLKAANIWLKDFWLKRVGEEKAFLDKLEE
ncbi:MAG: hypothetical protein V4654_06770 [Bdellovibrionota bacterium]